MKIYIKFRYPDDVFAIEPSYDLSLDDFVLPRICSRCGNTLYIPINLPDNSIIEQPLRTTFKPFPKENPFLVIRDEPDPITIQINTILSYDEQERLKRFPSVAHIDHNGFSILIDGVSKGPVIHKCYEG